jgi:hypothetical protein
MVKPGEKPGLLVVYEQCHVNFCRASARLLAGCVRCDPLLATQGIANILAVIWALSLSTIDEAIRFQDKG